jgi:hypothetical protein
LQDYQTKKKRETMANQPTITSNYAGEFAGKYISAAVLSANTIANNGVTVIPNVKFKSTLKKAVISGLVTDATCDFTDTGVVTLSDKVLTVAEKQVNLQLCKTPFESDWEAVSMGYSAFDNMPSTFSDFFIAKMLKDIALDTENFLWNATTGLGKLLKTDGATVIGTPLSITSANVIAEMGRVVDGIPAALYGTEDLRIYVSQNVAKAYVRALGGFSVAATSNAGVNAQGTTWYNGGELTFDGVTVFVANGLPANTMVAAQISNLYAGFGLLDDQNLVKTIDMADIDGSKNVRFIARFTRGLQVGIGADSVTYGIA